MIFYYTGGVEIIIRPDYAIKSLNVIFIYWMAKKYLMLGRVESNLFINSF